MHRLINTIRHGAAIVTIVSLVALGLGQTAGAATTAAPANPAASAQTAPARTVNGLDVVTGTLYDVTFGHDGQARIQASPDDITTQATWSYKFSKETTEKLYLLALAGATSSIEGICQSVAPSWLDPLCNLVATAIVLFLVKANPAGRCLKISVTTKLGWPPIKVSVGYVTC
ncbi:hypothetical protein [Lentzea sp. NPDC051838]|uniref:hypothetical protein n=1 Tax=Lentzea sp. NPDC051838 TaxID=3154849 RepID=UPI003427806E